MNNTDLVRYNIVSDKEFDNELRKEVKPGNISSFFIQAARVEIQRRRRERALARLRTQGQQFAHITDSAAWTRELRATDEERMEKLDL
jgi:hypothetical protein